MNAWQVARQLQHLLRQAAWPDGGEEPVFGAVLVTSGMPRKGIGQLRFPACMIAPLDAEADAQEAGLETQRFGVRVLHRVAADPWGESVLIGGARGGGQGSSRGRGLLEIEEEVFRAVAAVDGLSGVRLQAVWRSAVESAEDEELGYVATREYQLEAWVATERSYPAPERFAAADDGGGAAALTWRLPPARYDDHGLVLRRASGSTAPATPTDGTEVVVAADAVGVTDSPGAGTWSYGLWRTYDETGGGQADRFSPRASVTVEVV